MKSGVRFRLALCLVALHGGGHVWAQEADGGANESDAAGWNEGRIEEIRSVVDTGVASVIEVDEDLDGGAGIGGAEDGAGRGSGKSVAGDVEATARVDPPAAGGVDETGEVRGKIGECVGRRFKKCR